MTFWYVKPAVFAAKFICTKDPIIWFCHSSILEIKKKFVRRNMFSL